MDHAGFWNRVGKLFPAASSPVAQVKLVDDQNSALGREMLYLSFTT